MTICRQPARLWTFGVLAGYFNERISTAFVRHALYERDDADAEVHRYAGLTKAAGARTTEHALNNAFCREKPSFRGGSLKGASIKVSAAAALIHYHCFGVLLALNLLLWDMLSNLAAVEHVHRTSRGIDDACSSKTCCASNEERSKERLNTTDEFGDPDKERSARTRLWNGDNM